MANVAWTALCLAGLWGFLLSTCGLILNCFPARGVFERRYLLGWGGAVLCCFVAWMFGMANA
jgi:hypothetical protein